MHAVVIPNLVTIFAVGPKLYAISGFNCLNSSIKPVTIKREGSGYNERKITNNASAIPNVLIMRNVFLPNRSANGL